MSETRRATNDATSVGKPREPLPGSAHSEFLRHQEARLLALWLGPPKTELGPDGRSFVHTFLPGGSIADLGPGWSNVESVEEADRRFRDEECRGRGGSR